MFLPHGKRLGGVDWLQYAWTGRWPNNRCPEIGFLASRLAGKTGKRGTEYALHLKVVDPDGD